MRPDHSVGRPASRAAMPTPLFGKLHARNEVETPKRPAGFAQTRADRPLTVENTATGRCREPRQRPSGLTFAADGNAVAPAI